MKHEHISREEKNHRFKKAGEIIDQILDDPDCYPDSAVIFLWRDEELSTIFTKERLRLLRAVKEQTYDSFSDLAKALERDVSIVRKDVKMLEGYELLTLEKHGNKVKIHSETQGIYIPLERTRLLEEYVEEMRA